MLLRRRPHPRLIGPGRPRSAPRRSCDPLQRIGERLTQEQRAGYEDAENVDVKITGDRAEARLRVGDCTRRAMIELARDGDGGWRISLFAPDYESERPPCL